MVRFNPKARLDRSRVRDVGRGGGGGGMGGGMGGPGMRLPMPTSRSGCIVYAIILVVVGVVAVLGGPNLLGGLFGGTSAPLSASRFSDADTGRYDHCETGADANDDHDCARVAVENSLTDFWESQGEKESDRFRNGFHPEEALVTFSGGVQTQCGPASSAVGPFYCPADESIYLDTTFFDEVFEGQLGGPDDGFVEWYVIAHEYGHHISNLIGSMGQVTSQETGPTSPGVRLELQADCFAGMWTNHAVTTEDEAGEVLFSEPPSEAEIDVAIRAAETVGDDYIQKRSGGRVNPELWTHGSSEQRKHWFNIGLDDGDMAACDTFAASEAEVLGRS